MCGISGIYNQNSSKVEPDQVRQMLKQIQYRGPDESGIYIGAGVGMGSVRLSIIDLAQGQQPMSDPDGHLWIVYNGEIFNYIELRKELENLGISFHTQSDTEVLLLLFKQYREKCLEKLNGQFAFAIWDSLRRELFLARDRMGIRPLYYAESGEGFVFGSEIKCLLEPGLVQPELDHHSLNQVFTFWSIPTPGTLLKGIYELPPGHYMIKGRGIPVIRSYWNLKFQSPKESINSQNVSDILAEFDSLISDAVRLRLRSDVQVAAYLSGGLDSSTTTHFIKKIEPGVLNTFSIGFEEGEFDETPYQQKVSDWLDTTHHSIVCRNQDIAAHFAEVVWHTEIPILRTGAVPMFMLSKLVHEHGIKVVITGEGADEFLGGYNIFKEALIREFWSRFPESKLRPLLLQKLYPYLTQFKRRNGNVHKFFFGHRLTDTDSPVYSHLVRWNNSYHIRNHFHPEISASLRDDPVEQLTGSLPEGMNSWDLLSRAQWLESTLFLSGYLLSSQGDRMAMAHSVEGRYPFLDHRVIEFCSRLTPNLKLRGLNEKYLLKQLMKKQLPDMVITRSKQAYRAPVASSLLSSQAPEYHRHMLSSSQINHFGIFKQNSVARLIHKLDSGNAISENDNMAVAGILSTQILMDLFFARNNPFRAEKMKRECPVYYDKNLQTENYEQYRKVP